MGDHAGILGAVVFYSYIEVVHSLSSIISISPFLIRMQSTRLYFICKDVPENVECPSHSLAYPAVYTDYLVSGQKPRCDTFCRVPTSILFRNTGILDILKHDEVRAVINSGMQILIQYE